MPDHIPPEINRNPPMIGLRAMELIIFLCTHSSPLSLYHYRLGNKTDVLLVKIAGQLAQLIAILILMSQTPTEVLVLGMLIFLFGVMESGVSLWRAAFR